MKRSIVIVGAPSSIGIRPYDDGGPRHLDRAPGVLREQGLSEHLGARDHGDVVPPPYRDLVRPPGRPRNEDGVESYSRALARRRDHDEPWYGHDALRASPILDLPDAEVRERGPVAIADAALERLARPDLGGFWIHLDADVIDPAVVPAVDSPTPGGPGLDQLAELLTPLVRHPLALGMELTIYDPALDPDRTSAARLASLLERVLADA